MSKRFALIVLVMIGLVGGVGIASRPADAAKDAPGCEGLAAYRVAMFKAGKDYLASLDRDSIPVSRSPITYSSDDWTALAKDALDYQRAVKKITPPEFAKGWHQAQVEKDGLIQQLATTAASSGVLAAIAFKDQFDQATKKSDDALAAAGVICADFISFQHDWDALDGDINGTPVATPAS
jgi:hypothetical protein